MSYCLYTDGACRPNPGPGGWAAYVVETKKMVSGEARCSTNNEMEMAAVLYGLAEIPDNEQVTVVTDSKMVQGWLGKGWKCEANPKIAEMRDAIRTLLLAKHLRVSIKLVKGHDGDVFNEKVDREAARRAGFAKDLPMSEVEAPSLRLIVTVDGLCMENLRLIIRGMQKLGGTVSGSAEEYGADLELIKSVDIQNNLFEES